MWCYSKRRHTTELRTRETQRPGGQLMPSFQTLAPTAFSSKCTVCHKKLCPPWSSSCQLFTAKGKMTQLPLCTDLEMCHPDFMNSMDCFSENLTCHPISSIFFNIFCLSNRRGHYGKTIKLQVKAAYTVGQRLYKRRMGTTKCWNNLYLQGASRGAELSVAITEAAPWPLCSLIYV